MWLHQLMTVLIVMILHTHLSIVWFRVYCCVSLNEHAKGIFVFATTDGLSEYCVMPFRTKISQPSFKRMIIPCLGDLDGVGEYVDGIVVHVDTYVTYLIGCCTAPRKITQDDQMSRLLSKNFDKIKSILCTNPELKVTIWLGCKCESPWSWDNIIVCKR